MGVRTHCNANHVVFLKGQTERAPLFLTSTFLDPINIFSTAIKADKPFTFVPVKKSNAKLAPNYRQKVGYQRMNVLSILQNLL